MIMHHYSFANLGAMLEGIATLSKIAEMEGCTDIDAIEVDGGCFQKGRMTLVKKTCADDTPCFAIEFNESRNHREVLDAPAALPAPPAKPARSRRPKLVA